MLLAENRGATSQRLVTTAVEAALADVDLKILRGAPTSITIGHLAGRGGTAHHSPGPQGLVSLGGVGTIASDLFGLLGLGAGSSPESVPGGLGADVHPGQTANAGTVLEPVTGVFADFLHTLLRLKAEQSGVRLVPHQEARIHLVLLVMALGTDEDEAQGFLSLWTRETMRGEAWFRLVAVDPGAGKIILDESRNASRYFEHRKILGVGPFQRTDLPNMGPQR